MPMTSAYNRTTNYTYDRRGNRVEETSIHTQENRRSYEWDETDRLVRGTRGPEYGLYTSEYTYNGLGQRVNSTIMGPDRTRYDRDYVIDYTSPERNDIAEYNVGHYQWQPKSRVHDLKYLYTADGQRLQVDVQRYNQWSTNVTEYKRNVHEDILGSSTWYTRQESGYNANRHEYSTWGNNTKAPSYNYDPEYRATEPYYTGHPYDGSLNLYFAENRFYDPETGSWLSPDPVKDGLNWYQYCGSNPVSRVDPLGLIPYAAAQQNRPEPPQDRYSPAMQSRERSYYPKYACADTNYTLSDFEHDLDSFCAGLGSELVKLLYGYAGEVYIFSAEVTNLYLWGRPIDIAELNRIHQEKAEWIAKRIIEMDMKGEMPSEGALLGGKLTADLIGMGAGLGVAGYGGGQMIGGATMAIVAPGVGTVAVVSAIPTGALIYVAGSGGFLYAGNEFKENIDRAEENEGDSKPTPEELAENQICHLWLM